MLWGVTASGGKIPLDPEPVLGGNIEVEADGGIHFLNRINIEEARESGERLYVSHFATCPNADQHRR